MGRRAALAQSVVTMIAAGLVGLRAQGQAPETCGARDTLPTQVRPLTCRTATQMMEGRSRSATLRRLIDRIGELDGIVYITDAYYVDPRTRRVLSGALSHEIRRVGAHRILHISVAPESGDRSLITLAHELQHAVEVLEAPEVTTQDAVDRLFERIGVRVGASIMETTSALDVERAVARELSRKRWRGATR